MSRGLLDAQNGRVPKGFNRRTFLKLGVSIGAAAGGGLMLGFSLPAVSQGEAPPASRSSAAMGSKRPRPACSNRTRSSRSTIRARSRL